ncbi:substrate-binding domain-containing protein [Streptomyces hundungensis]|uniref:substrate-binding domain-containing protein n=1 Tax=Streptomyces hundungensis TaxID=1077946 RepID=UPI0033CE44B8
MKNRRDITSGWYGTARRQRTTGVLCQQMWHLRQPPTVTSRLTSPKNTRHRNVRAYHNDHDAIVLLPRLRAQGLSVPGDLAIVAYDDEVAALAAIPLTAVAPPKRAVGVAAVDMLALWLADAARARHHLSILPELEIRASSA